MTTASLDRTDVESWSLSAAMKDGSAAEHDEAETSLFVSELLAGRVNEAGYVAYLSRLRTVYATLENVGRALAEDPLVAQVYDPALERVAALDEDLAFWAPDGAPELESEAAAEYASVIAASAAWGGLFVAHHYTRYLGDLSGGQAIGALLDRNFGLGGKGVAFYAFPEIGKTKPYKDEYRRHLDALGEGLNVDERDRIVAEVKKAFTLNHALFAELGRDLESYRPEA